MSLPDTVFIFVLALIIFGPKKLPEIGRQIGKLVGEFRRASNEFKFQIEEELRQVDFAEKRSDRPSIAAPKAEPTDSESLSASPASEISEEAESIPVGQHPNIDNLDPSTLRGSDPEADDMDLTGASDGEAYSASQAPDAGPSIAPAEGAQPRTTHPYAGAKTAAGSSPAEGIPMPPVNGGQEPTISQPTEPFVSVNGASASAQQEASIPLDPTHAEVTHG